MVGDGEYKYEPEVLESLNELSVKYGIDFLIAVEDKRDSIVFLGILHELYKRHGLSDAESTKRIDAWAKWNRQMWSFTCSRCGATLEAGHDNGVSLGCVCGAAYSLDGWKKFHRDDTGGGSTTFSVVVPDPTTRRGSREVKCKDLDETDRVLRGLGDPSAMRIASVKLGKRRSP